MRTVADLHRMAKASGCVLVRVEQSGRDLVGHFECPDAEEGKPLATATLLENLTAEDTGKDALDPALVARICASSQGAARAAHAYVRDHVRFEDEEIETFAAPSATLRRGFGDCDDSARALALLAESCGVRARLVFFLQDGSPAHVTAQLYEGGRWRWAEATIAARFGEHPFAAMRRLRLARADLAGTPYIIEDGRAVALTKGIGAMGQQVARVATPVTAQDLANALAAAGSTSPATQVLVAQSAFETGAWNAVWNWNLGNVKATGTTDWFSMSATEGTGANVTVQASQWRSYPSLEQGAAAWLAFMNANYSTAMSYAAAGDVPNFVASLKAGGYFTGDADDYTAGVERYYAQYSSLAPSAAAGLIAAGVPTAEALAVLGVAVVAGIALAVIL